MTLDLFDGIEAQWQWDDVAGLTAYLDEVWRERPLFIDEEGEGRATGISQRFFTFKQGFIKPTRYVGFVQYKDLRLSISPRVCYNHASLDCSASVSHVLKWLSYCQRINFPFNEVPTGLTSKDSWVESLIFLFANYTRDVLSERPYFFYENVTEEMAFVRGRIDMELYIKENLGKGRHQFVHCNYDPFVYDNLFNRIVKYTCRVLYSLSADTTNRNILNNILFLLNEVADSYCSADDCSKVTVNRLCPEIGIITNMCAAFLNSQVYNTDGSSPNLCLLLPMEVIYEQYVAAFLKNHFPHLNACVQDSKEYVARTGKSFETKVFRMKHDILLPGQMIIDTKYKFRYKNDDLKGGVAQNDIYQMVTYLQKRNIKHGVLLYPMHFSTSADNDTYKFRIDLAAEELMITACAIDITEPDFGLFEEHQKLKFSQLIQETIIL